MRDLHAIGIPWSGKNERRGVPTQTERPIVTVVTIHKLYRHAQTPSKVTIFVIISLIEQLNKKVFTLTNL